MAAYNAALDTNKKFSLGSSAIVPVQQSIVKQTATPQQLQVLNKTQSAQPQVQQIAASVPQSVAVVAAPKATSVSSGGSSSGSYSAPKQIVGTPRVVTSAADLAAQAQAAAAMQQAQKAASEAQRVAAEKQAMIDQINALAAAQEKSKLAALEASKQSALGTLNKERGAIDPAYYAQKNQAAITNQAGVNNFQEFLANRGLRRSGAAAGNIAEQQASLQNTLGTLTAQQQAAIDDVASRVSNVNIGNASAIAQAQGDIQAQKIQNLIDQANKQKEYDLSQAQLTGYLNGNNTLARDQYTTNTGLSEAELTGLYKGANTLGQNQYLTDKALNEAKLTGSYDGKKTMDYTKMISDLQSAKLAQQGQTLQNQASQIENRYLPQEKQVALNLAKSNLTGQDLQNATTEMANKMKAVDLSYYSEVQKANYDNIVNQVQAGDIENAMNDLQLANLPEKLKTDLASTIADTAAKYSGIDVNQAQIANIQANTANTQKSTALMGTSSGSSKSGGGSSGGLTANQSLTEVNNIYKDISSQIDDQYWFKSDSGKKDQTAQGRRDMINYVTGLAKDGSVPDQVISKLTTKYNITQKDFDDVANNGQSTYGTTTTSSNKSPVAKYLYK
jgi:hypothetical protein